nr:MAG TPA: hypothetical protein [Caudoviricetes sp.]
MFFFTCNSILGNSTRGPSMPHCFIFIVSRQRVSQRLSYYII